MSRRFAKHLFKLGLLHTTKKELSTLVASLRFVTLHCEIVKPTGVSPGIFRLQRIAA